VTEEPMRRGAMLDLAPTNKEGLVGSGSSRAALAAVTMKWWSSRSSLRQQGGCTASSLPWTSIKQTLQGQLHGVAWAKAPEGPKKAG